MFYGSMSIYIASTTLSTNINVNSLKGRSIWLKKHVQPYNGNCLLINKLYFVVHIAKKLISVYANNFHVAKCTILDVDANVLTHKKRIRKMKLR